jgi:ABC-type Fe3+/spermidine/putrescine transport system ATPase subunit
MSSVQLVSVQKTLGGVKVVDDVSLTVEGGEFLTLLGPSGCGKTTTLRLLAGLEVPDQGKVIIGDSDVTHEPGHKRNVGMVFQSHALFPHMNIRDNTGFGLRMRGTSVAERRERADRALEQVHLAGFGGRMPKQLSGGQQQRAALARAIVFDPALLLLDEPFSALDRKLREALQVELRVLTRRIGITAIFVTHDQEEALTLSDRVAVMNKGCIEQIGRPADLFERPATRFVADFMGFGNIIDAVVRAADRDIVHFDVDGLSMSALPVAGLATGQSVGIGVRAERISLQPVASNTANQLAGTVTKALYQGAVATYSFRPDGMAERELVVREATGITGHMRMTVGERAYASWPHDAACILLR